MSTEELLRELKRVYEAERNKSVPTFSLNICMMLEDVIPKIEKLKKMEDSEKGVQISGSGEE